MQLEKDCKKLRFENRIHDQQPTSLEWDINQNFLNKLLSSFRQMEDPAMLIYIALENSRKENSCIFSFRQE